MKRTIAILLFEDAEELDFVGPWEVFSGLSKWRTDLCAAFTVSENGGALRCSKGLRVIADHSFATAPAADVLIIPGGQGRKVQVDKPRVIEYITRHASRAELTASVCTGAFLLERAGLLKGKRATTYWSAMDELRNLGVDVVDERWVDEGKVITAAGVSAGIDMSLHLAGRLWGPPIARKIQQGIQYFPVPPYQDVPIPRDTAYAFKAPTTKPSCQAAA